MKARPAVSVMLLGMLALSAAAHVAAFTALQWVPDRHEARAPLEVEAVELSLPVSPPAPQPAVSSAPQSTSSPATALEPARPVRAPRHAPPAPAKPEQQARPAPELSPPRSDDASPDWRVPPPAPSATAPLPPGPTGLPTSSPTPAPSFVPAAQLGRKPGAPSGLDGLLQRHYPRRARVQGVAGEVVVRMRIGADGRVGAVQVLRERPSGFEFGSACRNMLAHAPTFVPGLDHGGRAVTSEVTFTCSFEVED